MHLARPCHRRAGRGGPRRARPRAGLRRAAGPARARLGPPLGRAATWQLDGPGARVPCVAAPAHVPPAADRVAAHRRPRRRASPPEGCTARPTAGTSSGTSCSCFPFLTPADARARPRAAALPVAPAAAGARGGRATAGHRGAMFPWQSGSDGREETQTLHLNPRSGHWLPDNSHLQRHVGAGRRLQHLAVLRGHRRPGVPRRLRRRDDARDRHASSPTSPRYDPADDRYEICGVMGPDEYHDGYPGADEPGLDNNAYTNVMTVWVLRRALRRARRRSRPARRTSCWSCSTSPRPSCERWERRQPAAAAVLVADDGVDQPVRGLRASSPSSTGPATRQRYGDIARLDRILEAEGDTPNRLQGVQAGRRADAVLPALRRRALRAARPARLRRTTRDMIPRTISYYLARTSHGSTLSTVVHAWVLARSDRGAPGDYFVGRWTSDIADIQGGTTAEGIHLGAMAGTVDLLQRASPDWRPATTRWGSNPCLPDALSGPEFRLRYRGQLRRAADRLARPPRYQRSADPAGATATARQGRPGRDDRAGAGRSGSSAATLTAAGAAARRASLGPLDSGGHRRGRGREWTGQRENGGC